MIENNTGGIQIVNNKIAFTKLISLSLHTKLKSEIIEISMFEGDIYLFDNELQAIFIGHDSN